ncbi:MAG: hypothetical protein R2773_00665 [Flavobacteriaceae bacterium]
MVKIEQQQLRREVKQRIRAGVSTESRIWSASKSFQKTATPCGKTNRFYFKGDCTTSFELEKKGTTTVYHVLPDEKEHALIAAYLHKQENSKDQRSESVLSVKFSQMVFQLPNSRYKEDFVVLVAAQNNVFNYANFYNSIILDIASPPPQQSLSIPNTEAFADWIIHSAMCTWYVFKNLYITNACFHRGYLIIIFML